ncbi:MAG: vitamin K epoxide reductase family protein [Myxococcota bacterium]
MSKQPNQDLELGEIPPGWDRNPSAWKQRLPIVAMAVVACIAAIHLALYQLDTIPKPWEPFFGDGSVVILDSWVSKLLPISDAALGAFTYLLDAVTGVIGGRRRWLTMPWMVVLFGILVGPLGAVSVLLVILQPVLFNAWCTLCLLTAILSVLMIGPSMDEVLASLQHIKREKARGRSTWRVFWGLSDRPGEGAAKWATQH